MFRFYKGSIYASFLFLLFDRCSFASPVDEFIAVARNIKLAEDPVWEALIQTTDNISRVNDPHFILTLEAFSPQAELEKTIEVLTENPASACRFPARKMFIESKLGFPLSDYLQQDCKGYWEFKNYAPADKISLVYTSENLTQASSMMGHIMLKIEGENTNGLHVSHAVSYFTELDSINAAKVLWDSLFVGKEGFFKVSPYSEHINNYLAGEQRNVWEYDLKLTPFQLDIIQRHLWELKTANIPYFFHTYNCATLTQLILSVANPRMSPEKDEWVTPLDVVKKSHDIGLVNSTTVIPANKWKIRMLEDSLAKRDTILPDADFQFDDFSWLDSQDQDVQFISLELLKSYNLFQQQYGLLTNKNYKDNLSKLDAFAQQNALTDLAIDLSDYKKPTAAPNDSQMSVGFRHMDSKGWLQYRYMPASRKLEDDNRQSFSESALELASLSLLISSIEPDIELEEGSLYSMRTIVPYDQYTGGISSQLRLGVQQHRDQNLDRKLAVDIYSGIGLASSLTEDLLLYSQINVGAAISDSHGYIYAKPEVGLIFYQIFDMKTIASFSLVNNQRQSDVVQKELAINHSIYSQKNMSFHAEYVKRWTQLHTERSFSIYLKYLY